MSGWWRGCPGETRRMAAWFTFTIAFSTTLISQVWKRMYISLVVLRPRRNQMESRLFNFPPLFFFYNRISFMLLHDVFLNNISFSFRYLDPEFLSWISTNLKITKVCLQTETHASPTAGLILEFAWRTIRLWSLQVTASLEVQWHQCWGQTLSAPRTVALYLHRFKYPSTLAGR